VGGGATSPDALGWRRSAEEGRGKVTAAFRAFFLLMGISALAVVVFLIVASAI